MNGWNVSRNLFLLFADIKIYIFIYMKKLFLSRVREKIITVNRNKTTSFKCVLFLHQFRLIANKRYSLKISFTKRSCTFKGIILALWACTSAWIPENYFMSGSSLMRSSLWISIYNDIDRHGLLLSLEHTGHWTMCVCVRSYWRLSLHNMFIQWGIYWFGCIYILFI